MRCTRGFASLGLRIAAPVVFAIGARALAGSEGQTGHESENALALGLLGGMLFASLFDAVVLARGERVIAPRAAGITPFGGTF